MRLTAILAIMPQEVNDERRTVKKPPISDPINLFDYETLARKFLPQVTYDVIAGGATDEITLRRNRSAFDEIMFRPRILVDVSCVDPSTTVLGQRIDFPVMLAPAGSHGRVHSDGELASARAAAAAGTIMVLSSASSFTLEEVAKAADGPRWYQQYFYRDRGLTMEMAHRAKDAGYSALCITLDSKTRPKKERDLRSNLPPSRLPNYAGLGLIENSPEPGITPSRTLMDLRDHSATWDYLDWFVSNSPLPVIPKGVMTGEDAYLCSQHGVDSIVVSNHGGEVLDTTFAAVEVLSEVVAAIGNAMEVYVDGGIRRGSDVVKALALGARAVLIGRPVFWGLAVDGEAGVLDVLRILRDEIETTMAMCGRPSIGSIDGSLISASPPLNPQRIR